MAKKKIEPHPISVETNEKGASFWRKGLWCLDASTLLEDGTVEIDTKEFDVKVSRVKQRIYLEAKNFKPNSL